MPGALSKLAHLDTSCVQYVHPWQENCTIAHAGLILQAAQYSLRTYSAVYLLSLAMRGRIPTLADLRRTLLAIGQSTAFLTTNAFAYCMFLCIIRKYAGGFNFYTFSFVPAWLASLAAILIERPSRRGMLAIYTSNVASETLFNMAVVRGWVRPIAGGSCLLFGASAAAMLMIYRMGDEDADAVSAAVAAVEGEAKSPKQQKGDSIFEVLRFVVGEGERRIGRHDGERRRLPALDEAGESSRARSATSTRSGDRRESRHVPLPLILQAVEAYSDMLRRMKALPRHETCPHDHSCVHYGLHGGLRLFGVGLGIQVALKCVLQAQNTWRRGAGHLAKVLAHRDTVRLGVFLGGFAGIYRATSCALRHATDTDRPAHAIPAAIAASCAFAAYPDTTVALYAAWKSLHLVYNVAERRGYVPHVPHFDIVLYIFSTAMLFHAGIMEPLTLRTNYWKFLHSLSGGRLAGMNREVLSAYGLDTSRQLAEALRRTNTSHRIAFAL